MEKHCSSKSIALPSLDPPGTKRPLPAELECRPDRRQTGEGLSQLEPFDTLPRSLIPTRRHVWRPPRLYYGWHIPRQILLKCARKSKKARRPGRTMDILPALDVAIHGMIRVDGVADIAHDLLRIMVTHMGAVRDLIPILSVYSNYHLKRRDLPSEETMRKITECLGIEEPPRWYLDAANWWWQRW